MKAGAPKARNMIARGKREARRPWLTTALRSRPERPKYNTQFRPFRARTVSWIAYQGRRASRLPPGYHIPRRWRCELQTERYRTALVNALTFHWRRNIPDVIKRILYPRISVTISLICRSKH